MNKREKILLVIAVIVIAASFGIKRVILPTIDRFYTVTEEFDESVFKLKEAKLQLMSTDKYIKRLEEVNIENKLLEQYFYIGDPTEVRLKVLKFLDGEIKELGLVVENKELIIERKRENNAFNDLDKYKSSRNNNQLNQGEVYTVKIPIKLTYRIQLKGSYQQLLSLLEDISTYHKYYSIGQLDIKTVNAENQLDVFIVIESYCIEGDKDENREI